MFLLRSRSCYRDNPTLDIRKSLKQKKRIPFWRQPSSAFQTRRCCGSLSLSFSLLRGLVALWIFHPRTFAVAIAQLRHRRLRQRDAETWNGLKARSRRGHHFRSRFRFRVADDPLQGHDGVRRVSRIHMYTHVPWQFWSAGRWLVREI